MLPRLNERFQRQLEQQEEIGESSHRSTVSRFLRHSAKKQRRTEELVSQRREYDRVKRDFQPWAGATTESRVTLDSERTMLEELEDKEFYDCSKSEASEEPPSEVDFALVGDTIRRLHRARQRFLATRNAAQDAALASSESDPIFRRRADAGTVHQSVRAGSRRTFQGSQGAFRKDGRKRRRRSYVLKESTHYWELAQATHTHLLRMLDVIPRAVDVRLVSTACAPHGVSRLMLLNTNFDEATAASQPMSKVRRDLLIASCREKGDNVVAAFDAESLRFVCRVPLSGATETSVIGGGDNMPASAASSQMQAQLNFELRPHSLETYDVKRSAISAPRSSQSGSLTNFLAPRVSKRSLFPHVDIAVSNGKLCVASLDRSIQFFSPARVKTAESVNKQPVRFVPTSTMHCIDTPR
ncbi:MAG: hypothetical protein MHM6MM_006065, partial [Cercozoa sp. M6MM]